MRIPLLDLSHRTDYSGGVGRIVGYDCDAGVEELGVANFRGVDKQFNLFAFPRLDAVTLHLHLYGALRAIDATNEQRTFTSVDD